MARRKKANRRGNHEGSIYETLERGERVWVAQVSIPQELGPAKRRTLRGKSFEEVKAKLDALKQQVQDGTIADTDLTLEAYLARWLKEKARSLEPTTFEQYEYRAGKVTQHLGKERLHKLTPLKIQTAIGRIADDTGVSTANKCLALVRQAYKQAVRWQMVARNPAEAVDALPEKQREMTLWTPEQAARFIDAARAHRLFALFYAAIAGGLRRAEALGLRWRDIDTYPHPETGVPIARLTIRQTLVKTKDGRLFFKGAKTAKGHRIVAVSPDVVAVLEDHRQRQEAERAKLEQIGVPWPDHDLVFTSEVGTPISPDNLVRLRNRLMDLAGVPHVTLHGLRHLHASICIKSGMNPKEVADRLGHSRASFTLDRYTHMFEAQRAANAVSLLDFLPACPERSERKREPTPLN